MVLLAGTRTSLDETFTDLASPPEWLFPFAPEDQTFDLLGQLIGIAHGTARAIAQGLQSMLPVTVKNLVAGLPGYPEIPTNVRHRLTVQHAGHETQAFLHDRTRFPRHQHLPPKGEKCYPCVRYRMSPMSQAAHNNLSKLFSYTPCSLPALSDRARAIVYCVSARASSLWVIGRRMLNNAPLLPSDDAVN